MQQEATVAQTPMREKRGLVLAKYGLRAASTRQRIAQMTPAFTARGITLTIAPLFDDAYLEALLVHGRRNLRATVMAYLRRFWLLRHASRYDFIWVQYELFPYLPAAFERLLTRKKPLILDYDDAIFHQYDTHPNPWVRALLGGKLRPLMRRASLVLCGNRYLQAYVAPFCPNTQIVPTVVDVTQYHCAPAPTAPRVPVIGWIGSPSTWRYVAPLLPLLYTLVQQGLAQVLVIGAGKAADPTLPFTFRDWQEANEIADIQSMDIGIMPIPDEPWARGKCGYKLIQYMACGLPVVGSPVGVNQEIVVRGVNGFLATSEEEWRAALMLLVGDADLRARMGRAGRKTIEARYSIQEYGPRVAQWVRHSCSAEAIAGTSTHSTAP